MEQKLVCDTVNDLLPIYIEHMTSETSNKSIEDHLEECDECKNVLEKMRQPVYVETAPEVINFKKFYIKSRMKIFYWIMGIAAVLAVLTCFIVNLAIDKRLTWFYIVTMGIFTAYLPTCVLIISKKYKFIKSLLALNGCSVVLLGIIQIVLNSLMNLGGIWFWDTALPICVIWSGVVWIGVGCYTLLHLNISISLAIITILTVPGNFLTNLIAGEEQNPIINIINGLGTFGIALVFFIIGILIHLSKKNNLEHNSLN